MKAKELKGQSGDNLAQTLHDTERHLFQLRFQSATDRLETPSEIKKAKRDIARLKTEQRARELVADATAQRRPRRSSEWRPWKPKADGPGKRRIRRAIARLGPLTANAPADAGARRDREVYHAGRPSAAEAQKGK